MSNAKAAAAILLAFALGAAAGVAFRPPPAPPTLPPAFALPVDGAPDSTATTPAGNARRPLARPFVPDAPLAERVVIVSVDGLRPDLLLLGDAPNIRGLLPAASYTFWATTVDHPYVYTLPSHVSMLTGVVPDRHGVTWNEYIEQSYPQSPTLFEVAGRAGRTTAMASGKMKFIALAKPGTLDWSWLPSDEPVPDAHVAGEAVRILRAHRPDVLFVHLPGVDTAGHLRGWGSREQLAAIAEADAAVGRVLSAVRDLGLEERTLRIITADHGGHGMGHWGHDPRSRTIPWIAAGPGVARNRDLTRYAALGVNTVDTFATACGALGIPLPPGLDGRFVQPILEPRELLQEAP